MDQHLPRDLAYHGPQHTFDQVVPAVEQLCADLEISGHKLLILVTAALLHDIGFCRRYTDNETEGQKIAAEMLPQFGYPPPDIQAVCRLILATRMPQKPANLDEEILCDADLAVLGTDLFFETSMMLRREISCFCRPVPLIDWLDRQHDFLNRHRYFTRTARLRYNPGKAANLAQLGGVVQCLHQGEPIHA